MNQRDNGFGCRAGTLATLGLAAGSRDLPRTACKQVVTVEKHFVSDSKKKKKKKMPITNIKNKRWNIITNVMENKGL